MKPRLNPRLAMYTVGPMVEGLAYEMIKVLSLTSTLNVQRVCLQGSKEQYSMPLVKSAGFGAVTRTINYLPKADNPSQTFPRRPRSNKTVFI